MKYNDLPIDLPVYDYPEILYMENQLNFNNDDPPDFNINKIESSLSKFANSDPYVNLLINNNFTPDYNKLLDVYDKITDINLRKKYVNEKVIPFFVDWILFEMSRMILLIKFYKINVKNEGFC